MHSENSVNGGLPSSFLRCLFSDDQFFKYLLRNLKKRSLAFQMAEAQHSSQYQSQEQGKRDCFMPVVMQMCFWWESHLDSTEERIIRTPFMGWGGKSIGKNTSSHSPWPPLPCANWWDLGKWVPQSWPVQHHNKKTGMGWLSSSSGPISSIQCPGLETAFEFYILAFMTQSSEHLPRMCLKHQNAMLYINSMCLFKFANLTGMI